MRNVFTIAGREIRSYFVSPIAYVVLTGFLLLGGWFFFNLLARFNMLLTIYSAQQNPQVLERLNLNEFVIAPLLHNLSVILVILIPVITMRSLAEEKKSGGNVCPPGGSNTATTRRKFARPLIAICFSQSVGALASSHLYQPGGSSCPASRPPRDSTSVRTLSIRCRCTAVIATHNPMRMAAVHAIHFHGENARTAIDS